MKSEEGRKERRGRRRGKGRKEGAVCRWWLWSRHVPERQRNEGTREGEHGQSPEGRRDGGGGRERRRKVSSRDSP